MGVGCRVERLQVDALLSSENNRYVVAVNSGAPVVRQRFSICHELGHIHLFETTQLSAALSHSNEDKSGALAMETESLCDAFAGALLLPSEEVCDVTSKLGVTGGLIRLLRSKYGTSLDVSARRVVASSFWRCAIILWDPKLEDGRLRRLAPLRFWRNNYLADLQWPTPIQSDDPDQAPLGALLDAYSVGGRASIGECLLRFGDDSAQIICWSERIYADREYLLTIIVGEPGALNLLRTWQNMHKSRPRQASFKFD